VSDHRDCLMTVAIFDTHSSEREKLKIYTSAWVSHVVILPQLCSIPLRYNISLTCPAAGPKE
jgi:hypothetical protein